MFWTQLLNLLIYQHKCLHFGMGYTILVCYLISYIMAFLYIHVIWFQLSQEKKEKKTLFLLAL